HMENLGNSIGKIASEKAGIIKRGSDVVCAGGKKRAISVIERRCKEMGARLHLQGSDFEISNGSVFEKGGIFDYREGAFSLKRLKTPLVGMHQLENAALAVASALALRKRGWEIPNSAIIGGLKNTKWPGRLEIMPGKPKILLDGAHNLDGMAKLKNALEGIFLKRRGKLVLVIGIMADKEYGKMIKLISPLADGIVFTRTKNDRSAKPEELAKSLGKNPGGKENRATGGNIKIEPDLLAAIAYASRDAGRDGMVLITGSLYLVGEARKLLA
ncbi:MAG: cyanophycin synthetase, partial [Candidatus Micrarchaeota archaeon]